MGKASLTPLQASYREWQSNSAKNVQASALLIEGLIPGHSAKKWSPAERRSCGEYLGRVLRSETERLIARLKRHAKAVA